MASTLEFDTSLFPIVIVRFAETPMTDDEMHYMFAQWEKLFATAPTRYAVLLDSGRITTQMMTAAQRRAISEWEQRHAAETRRCNVGVAVLLQSSVVRGIYTAIRWLFPGVTPETSVATLDEGFDVCIKRLETAGIAVPMKVRVAHAKLLGPAAT